MDNVPQPIKELIVKFLQREAVAEEVDELTGWLLENEAHRQYFDELNNAFQATVTIAKLNHEKIDKAWSAIYRRIDLTDKDQSHNTRITSNTYYFLRLAAAISAIAILSFLGWNYFKSSSSAKKNTIVYNSKRLNTKVVLPDSSVVWLNTNSALEYAADFGTTTREVTLKGEAFFDVSKDQKSFIVKTASLSIYVKGTRFNVRAYAGEEDVKTTLEEGKVELRVKGERDVFTMKPGDQITFNANLKRITHDVVDPSDFSSWKEERLVFDDTPLSDIILKLENRYKVSIRIDSALAQRERLSMTIEQETIEEVLEFIQLSSRLKYRKIKNQITIYE